MLQESQVFRHWDVVYSCFVPHEMLTERRMPVHVLVHVYSGEMLVDDGIRVLRAGAGAYVFLRRDHRVALTKRASADGSPYKAISIRFERAFLRAFYGRMDKASLPAGVARLGRAALLLPPAPALQSLFLSLSPYADARVRPAAELVRLKMEEAVYCLLAADARFYPTLFDFNEAWKIDLLPFMEANYAQDMSLSELAAYSGRSLATFKRDFAKVSDLTPEKWLLRRRLDRAYELLSRGGARPADVYAAAGFKNRSHFARAFKQCFGVPPGGLARQAAHAATSPGGKG